MQHSIIVRFFMSVFNYTRKFYRFSFTRGMIGAITNTTGRFFRNSILYRIFTSENPSKRKFLQSSSIGKVEVLLQKIIAFFNPIYLYGVEGSSVIKNINKLGRAKGSSKVLSFILIGAVAAFSLLSAINKEINSNQLYISAIIIFIALNLYFIDIGNLYRNSFIRKVVDGIFDI